MLYVPSRAKILFEFVPRTCTRKSSAEFAGCDPCAFIRRRRRRAAAFRSKPSNLDTSGSVAGGTISEIGLLK